MSDELSHIGDLLRHDMGELMSPAQHAALRARLVDAAAERRAPRSARLAYPLALAAVCLAAVLLWFRAREAPELGFVVGPSAQKGEEGAYYSAPGTGLFPLRFEDGTTVTLEHGSGVRVSKARRDEGVLLVERGTMHFRVVHDDDRSWEVAAGAYVVHVTGTEFTVEWESASDELTVQMQSGEVLITGPGLDGGVTVRGHERFVSRVTRDLSSASPPPRRPAEASEEASATVEPSARELEPTEPSVEAAPKKDVPAPAAPERGKSAVPRGALWSSLVVDGRHDRVLEAAEARGIEDVLRSANSADLRALADAARFRGRTGLAHRALEALRERFPGTARATAAAFVLGRLDDAQGNTAAALRWYEAYLSEGGPLAPEAKGRRMIALHKLGHADEARRLAREYLETYPNGAYAKHARDIAR